MDMPRKVSFRSSRSLCLCVVHSVEPRRFLVPSSTGYPSQSYSSPQQPPTPSHRSTVQTTATYDHASSSSYPSPPPLSGSTSYNPSFPVPEMSVRYPSNNSSGAPPPPPPPISRRSATMPTPIPNTASSVPHDMQHPN